MCASQGLDACGRHRPASGAGRRLAARLSLRFRPGADGPVAIGRQDGVLPVPN